MLVGSTELAMSRRELETSDVPGWLGAHKGCFLTTGQVVEGTTRCDVGGGAPKSRVLLFLLDLRM